MIRLFRRPAALDVSIRVNAPTDAVFAAFFDHDALRIWRQVDRSVTMPRALGPYALEWLPAGDHDEVLGRLGGVFRGTVMHVEGESGFFVADAYWLPCDGHPIGPMAFEAFWELEVGSEGQISSRVRVTQHGFEESARWRRYYELLDTEWTRALGALKMWLESR
jgi:hypothetical protein